MIKEMEYCGITSIVETEYFNVNMNLDMRADVEMAFEIDGKEYKKEFQYFHVNQISRFTVMCNRTFKDIEDLKTGENKARVFLTLDEVLEDITEKMIGQMYDVTTDEAVLKKIENDDMTVKVKVKNIKLNEGYDISESIKEAYKQCISVKELEVVDAFVIGLKHRLGAELGLFSIEMSGKSNRLIIEGRSARVEDAKLVRRQGGLCLYSKCSDVFYGDEEYLCLLVNGDSYNLVRYKGTELNNMDMCELFRTDNDGIINKLIVME